MTLAVVILSLLSIQSFAQAPPLGTAADYAYFMAPAPTLGTAAEYVLFTTVGAVGNTGISQITGNVGTNSGAITGFGNVNGVMHTSDGPSGICAADLLIAYNQLNDATPTFFPAPLLGNGVVFNAGVYQTPAATTLSGELILDAQNDPNAVFIIQIEGPFATAANSKVTLRNGALACNVFWKIEGLVDMASGTTMRGTVIANNAAINMNAGDTLEGRALSINGAVNVSGVMAYTPIGCGSPILMGPAAPDLVSAACYAIFSGNGPVTNAGISYVTGDVGTNVGLTTGFDALLVTGMIHPIPDGSTAAAAADLLNAYNYLKDIPFDIELLFPAQFGNNLVLTPHTYLLNAATSLTDTLYLNGGGQADAIFVIKIFGALNTSNYSKVVLTNGTLPENVFWVVEGAVNITDYSIFKGTVIANNGAVELGTGANIDGRAFTTTGAIGTAAVTVTMPPGCGSTLPPEIVTGPENQTVCEGDMVSFTVSATGDGLEYQWRKGTVNLIDGINIFGSTTDSLTINPVLLSDAALDYNVVVTGTYLPAATSENVSLIVQALPVVYAGADVTIPTGMNYKFVDATATNFSSLLWTGGLGIFDDDVMLNATYTPALGENGSVRLVLTAQPVNPCMMVASDTVYITYQEGPVVYAGADETICEGSSYQLAGTAQFVSSVEWSGGLGSFNDPTLLTAIYTPAIGETGLVELTLTGYPIIPSTDTISDVVVLTFQLSPVIAPMNDLTVTEAELPYCFDATATNYSSLLWTTDGTGTFADATIEDACYTPSAADILAGSVELCLTAQPIGPCAVAAKECFIFTILPVVEPVANAGEDQGICEGQVVNLIGSAQNYSSVLWSGGDGVFSAPASLITNYTPGLVDILNGTVELCLTAVPIAPAQDSAVDCLTLTIQMAPMVEPLADTTICENAQQYIIDVTASNYSTLTWTTTGTGIFNPIDIQDVSYSPSAADILAGFVELCVTANPEAPCIGSVTECFVLTFQKAPVVYAGADATIPTGLAYTFADATATDYSALLWTGGLGTFDDATMLNATYTPALGEDGSVKLALTAQPINPCTLAASDTVYVTIQEIAIVNAGADAVVCEGTPYQLAGTAQFVSSVLWSGGLGTFDDATILNATYTPAVGETGPVTLTLTGYPIIPSADPVTDAMVLTIQAQPVVNAGADMTVCDNVLTIQLTGTASNNSGIMWHGGNGFFDDDVSLTTFYNVDAADIAAGSVTLCLTATPIAPCQGSSVDCITITFDPSPTISNLQDATICDDVFNYCFTGVTATNYSSLLWTGGDGAFDNATTLNPCYTPGAADVLAGEVILTLTAQPIGACNIPAVESMTLYIVGDPTIELDAEMYLTCANYDFELEQWLPIGLAPVVENASSVLWTTTSVDGFFDNPAAALTSYNVGISDKWNGSVTLTITAYGDENCGVDVVASIIIYIPQQIIEVLPGTVWRGISSYVDKSTTSVAEVMDPVVVVPGSQSLVIMHNKNGKYFWPEQKPAINQLGLWQPIGYKARFKAEGCLPIYGDVAYDTVAHNFTVTDAFTYIPCLTNYPVEINTLFAGHENQILLIHSWEEGTIWVPDPNVISPLQLIRPGSAYMIINKAGANYSITFPSFDFNAATVSKAVVPPAGTDYVTPWNTPVNTAQPHFILFADEVISTMQAGDIVGAFDRYDACVGTTEIGVKTDLIKLLVMGDDPSTEAIDGYQDGENMTFKLYRPSTEETFDVTFIYDANYPSYDNKFAIYGVSNVTGMTTTLTSVNELVVDRSVNVYPNPANEVINIASDYDLRKVTLVNYVGQTVFSQVVDGNNFQINVSNFVNGMYFVRIETVQGNVVTKPISIQ